MFSQEQHKFFYYTLQNSAISSLMLFRMLLHQFCIISPNKGMLSKSFENSWSKLLKFLLVMKFTTT